MDRISCSVGILTRNSAATLRRALESVSDFEDIIVCDGGSTDDTLEIAAQYGARIIGQDPAFQDEYGRIKDYAGARNQCIDAARHAWFLYIDSDECATPGLVSEIRDVIAADAPTHLIYNLSPRIMLDGRLIRHSSNYPGWQKRLFNKAAGARFRKPVHERIAYDTERFSVGYLQEHWLYFITNNVDLKKQDRYALLDAQLYQTKDTARFLHLAATKLTTMASICMKAFYNRVRYGSAYSMPLRLEYSRIHYQALLLWYLCKAYFGKRL